MRTRFVYLRPTTVLHYRAIGPYDRSVREAWGALLGWLDARDLRRFAPRAVGVIDPGVESNGSQAIRYDACVQLAPGLKADPEFGIVRRVTPGGAYALGQVRGCYERIREGFRHIRAECAQVEQLRIDIKRPCMEIYLDDPARMSPGEWLAQLCVPIRTEPDPRKLFHVRDEELELDA